ncbi:PqqD family peptide modification chaperone [Brachybacterium saurashtrense]|uniref:PqqD family peptide modification chaperone n=1 Tax=Brachybacterium saurashtrense TaxID=556288 RepID=A0A345YNA6_9MICO|nr:PqqD family peptide modification chaperone [Brachybacterium saurashtrense]AXK45408.1 PqqD family peptide modification chaperone [Brachybacterium saurashtrense]RRR21835.1 PqqD family peptide modification chaperone [Brachybacterium saurashtrense]
MSALVAVEEQDRLDLVVFDRPVTVLLPPDPDGERRARLRDAWSRCLSPGPPAAGAVLCDLRAVTAPTEEADSGARLGDLVTTAVTTRTMESALGTLLLLHAAGLAAEDGRVMALCAPPGTGKTTATLVLARRFGYVTDETVAVVPGTGQVLPYPKPLQIIDREVAARKVARGPEELGLRAPSASTALHLGPVIVLDRSLDPAGDAAPTVTPLPLAEALPRIVAQTSSLHLLPRPLQTLCALMDAHGGPWLLHYAEAETLPEVLDAWLAGRESRSAGPESWESAVVEETSPSPPCGDGAVVRRAPVADAVAIPGGVAVLRGGDFFLLQGVGATLWERLTRPRTLDELTEALVAAHGTVEGADGIVAELVEQLRDRGLLSIADGGLA